MLTRFTVNDLVRVFGRAVFERGLQYADDGAVFSMRQEGNILRGQVMGSHLYQTHFRLIPPYECWCTCPYDGSCKHAAALAVTWLRGERAVGERSPAPARIDSIRDRLGRMNPHELLDLIVELIDTVPGAHTTTLELLLRRDVAVMGRVPGLAHQEAAAVRSALRSLLPGASAALDGDDEWEDDWEEESEDDWEYESEDDWERHAGIENEPDEELLALDGQIEALIRSIESCSLPEGLPFRVLALIGCSVELVEAVGWPGSVTSRWSRQIERMMKSVASLVAETSCPDEIRETALSELLGCYAKCASNFGSLLRSGLVGASSNPELSTRLLGLVAERSRSASEPELKRFYDLAGEIQANSGAVRAALESLRKAGASSTVFLELAEKCQKVGDTQATIEAAQAAVSMAVSWNVTDVRRRAARLLMASGERVAARTLLQENFRESPSLGAATGLLDTTEGPDERRSLSEGLVAQLGKTGDPELRVRLHLEAGKPQSALRVLEEMKEYRPELQMDVAAGIAELDIDTAVDLWSKAITHFIGRKNRSAYAEAAKALVNMRRALGNAQQRTRWQKYYWDLQDRYRSYRALKEELEQAGL